MVSVCRICIEETLKIPRKICLFKKFYFNIFAVRLTMLQKDKTFLTITHVKIVLLPTFHISNLSWNLSMKLIDNILT